jgi:hypothetical protein
MTGDSPIANTLTAISAGVAAVRGALLAVTAALLTMVGYNAYLTFEVRSLARELPVRVVPGALPGVYAAGLTRESVAKHCAYLASLGSTYTPGSFDARIGDLRHYMAPHALMQFDTALKKTREEILTHKQSRFFVSKPGAVITRLDGDGFAYRAQGDWTFLEGSIALPARPATIDIVLHPAAPDDANPYGTTIDRFELRTGEDEPPKQ